ncbi:MAG: TonB-dependent receptor [Lewinellaceae bacterium]|nr:TonB-dependent receptor [Lewinellaceae bacterium]
MKKLSLVLGLVLFSIGAMLAQRTVTGKVTDQNGEALIGASILVKGTNSGTVTDIDGSYSVRVPEGANVLVFSYTGFETVEITLGASNVVDVSMAEGVTLETAVVTALGITREERSLGYSVDEVSGADLTNVRDANVVNFLAGRAAGVTVVGSSGNLGGSSRVTIRGIKSISGNNQPLFVVDGVPMDNSNFTTANQARGGGGYDYGNAIQDLNPEDIENISVLKGQAAAALYGSRGANGVIMVTTKKGTTRKGVGVSFNTSLTFDKVAFGPEYQNEYGGGVDLRPFGFSDGSGYYDIPYVQFNSAGDTVAVWQSFDLVPFYGVDESFGTAFNISTQDHFNHLAGLAYGSGQSRYSFFNGFGTAEDFLMFRDWNSWDEWDTDHYGIARRWEANPNNPLEFFETGTTQSYNLAFEGGNDRGTFRLSLNRLDQKGYVPNSSLKRNTVSFNGTLNLSEKLEAFVGVNYVGNTVVGRPGTGYDGSSGRNVSQMFNQWWHRELRFDDMKAYKNPDGTQRTWNRISATNPNPQYWDNPYWIVYENYQNDGRDRMYGHAGITYKPLSWLSITGRLLSDFYSERREERIAVGSVGTSSYTEDTYGVKETNADLIIRAEKYFGDNLSLSAFVGGNKRWQSTDRTFGQTVGGLSVPGLYRLQNSVGRPSIINTLTKREVNSLFGGASFGFKNYLYLDLTARNDWSSTLPTANNSYFYPSASLGFVFSEFFSSNTFSFGKLRLAWGQVGNDTDPYNVYDVYLGSTRTDNTAATNFGSLPSYTVPNTKNNAELKSELTTSIEAGLDLRFFKDRIGLDLTYYTGKTTNQIIPLGTTPTTGYTRQYINAGEISNEGVEASLDLSPVRTKDFSWNIMFNIGKNTNMIVDLNADDPTLTNLPIINAPFAVSLNAYEGQPYGTILGYDYIYDADGNRLVDPDGFYLTTPTVVPIGNVLPDFTGGITNTFTYKGLYLSAFIDFRKGGDIFSLTNLWGKYSGLLQTTVENNIREDGIIVDGVFADLENGSPIVVDEGDPDVDGDEIYKSSGVANDVVIDAQSHYLLNGGYFIGKADVYDGSFVKLREASIGYMFPRNLFNDRIQELRLSVVGRNLAILHKNIPNVDPDGAISAGNIQGLEGGQGFSTRSIGINLSLKF